MRTEIDDGAAVAGDHVGQCRRTAPKRGEERAFEFQIDLLLSIKVIRLPPDRASGVIDQNIYLAKSINSLLHQRLRLRQSADIRQNLDRLDAMTGKLPQSFRGALPDTLGNDNLAPFRR